MNNPAITPDPQSELHKFRLFYEHIDDNTPERRRQKRRQAK